MTQHEYLPSFPDSRFPLNFCTPLYVHKKSSRLLQSTFVRQNTMHCDI